MSKEKKSRKPAIKWDEVKNLGVIDDYTLAARLGTSAQAVQQARLRRGIPAAQGVGCPPMTEKEKRKRIRLARRLARTQKWDWTLSDAQMVRRYKIDGEFMSDYFFSSKRELLGIPLSSELKRQKRREKNKARSQD